MKIDVPRELLYEEYIVKEKPMHQIASEQGLSVGLIYNRVKEYSIPSRHHLTKEAKEKISLANTGRKSPRKGVHLSNETKKKISEANKGSYRKASEFGGHRKKRTDGYIKVFVPDHPNASRDGYVMEHTLVMEKHIGRYLEKEEVVHHINHIRNDNRIENLKLMTFKEHAAFHLIERRMKGTLKQHTTPVMNITTGQTFESIKQASIYYNVSPSSIRKACNNPRRHCRDCKWQYA